MNLMEKYRAKLKKETLDSVERADDLPRTPQARLEKPLLIESAILKDRLYLVANEEQAKEIEPANGVCYLPGEIRALLERSAGRNEVTLRDYLSKVHMVKKMFPGSRIVAGPG